MTAIEVFGAYADVFRATPLSDEVIHHAKRAVVDWYASLFPGLATEPVRLLETTLIDDLDRGAARLAFGRSATTRTAALINGAAAHAAEVDDSFRDAMYHPGAATIATALAVAQETEASGLEFLRAVVLGYEISTRIGVVMGRPHYTYWHSTGTVGTFGAASAAAYLYGLDSRAFAHALATAATFAAGLQQAFRMDSMSKPLHPGRAAEGGVLSAQLAARGVTGSLDVLDGESGLGQAMSDGPDWSAVGATLGHDFHVTRLTFKNHIGCGHTFAAIDGALALQRETGLHADRIARVRVGTYRPALDIACYQNPTTVNEARFSLKYVVATALVHGSVRLAAYMPARLDDPATRALMARIEVAVDPELDAAFPGKRAARIEFETDTGERFSYLQPNRKGDPEAPLSDAELDDKMLELAMPVIGDGAARALLERLRVLDTLAALDW
ncbi:MmgE/PrpD family protein [Nitrogeniibacter aestuarii]|uniref:MmgE/PrpD family protein n=1 Tax=Nitrogeniibacter aestuarii TaxID=2815343 RepID=UPI001E5BACE2|nr:MmgE/PrpD family protein [Nitrogeniibacter aestuarii]